MGAALTSPFQAALRIAIGGALYAYAVYGKWENGGGCEQGERGGRVLFLTRYPPSFSTSLSFSNPILFLPKGSSWLPSHRIFTTVYKLLFLDKILLLASLLLPSNVYIFQICLMSIKMLCNHNYVQGSDKGKGKYCCVPFHKWLVRHPPPLPRNFSKLGQWYWINPFKGKYRHGIMFNLKVGSALLTIHKKCKLQSL